ncbi:MAG: sigma-70 family RNA polymerase sigma factor [Bacteroidales bacterium]|nr:sigma-70 family RNA polymerase sigma factor [Bacteroidales bacterium]
MIIDDNAIIEKLRNPKTRNEAFDSIVKKYSNQIYYHIRRMVIDHDDANDLVQDSFLKAYTNIDKFRFDSAIYTWIYRIATNTCLNFLEKKKRQFTFSAISYEDSLADKIESSSYFDGDELQKKLQKSILKLPEKQRLVFNMKYYDDLKYEEISEILKTSVGGLKASYHHAVNKIEKFINED